MTRTLIYAMQSSGGSVFAFNAGWTSHLAGRRVLCIPDLWNPFLTPALEGAKWCDEIILKAVVTTTHSLESHIRSFKPDHVMLFSRNREDNELSLSMKPYVNEGGTMQEKFDIFHREQMKNKFPTYTYEETFEQLIPWPRTQMRDEMTSNNFVLSTWAKAEFEKQWGFGGINFYE